MTDGGTEALVDLQAVDTDRDRLRHRLDSLAEIAAVDQAESDLHGWQREDARHRVRLTELEESIGAAEAASHEIDEHRTRLEAQLKTVIAPREAEALQREIAGLVERRNELDEAELTALDELATVEQRLSALGSDEAGIIAAVEEARRRLAAARAELLADLAVLDERADGLRAMIDSSWLTRYDHLRVQLGTAVARLVGGDCVGCPSTLSPGEVEIIKNAPPGVPTDCPQCGRLVIH